MTNLIAQIAKLGQLTLGNAQYNDFAAPGLNLDMANSLMERAEARAGRGLLVFSAISDGTQS